MNLAWQVVMRSSSIPSSGGGVKARSVANSGVSSGPRHLYITRLV